MSHHKNNHLLIILSVASLWTVPVESYTPLARLQAYNCLQHRRTACRFYAQADDKDALGVSDAAQNQQQTPPATDLGKAATRTVNERLMAELEEQRKQETYGARSSIGKKMGLSAFKSSTTDQERDAAIQEARDLNGVNPLVAIGGSMFAMLMAAGLWRATQICAGFFATHPGTSDVYFIQRASSVFRNVVMGLMSLASGFFGVTGFGIFCLGLRVAFGVMRGELDPTPIKQKESVRTTPNVLDLMMGKKPGRRGGGGDNMFGT
jgi:hypothetical protein